MGNTNPRNIQPQVPGATPAPASDLTADAEEAAALVDPPADATPAPPAEVRVTDVEAERNEKLIALKVINPDPGDLPDVSTLDATKLERRVLTKQGWLLPAR